MKASTVSVRLPPLKVTVSPADSDEELERVSRLRARSFYVYPPERAFAGQRHQLMKSQEEFEALKIRRLEAKFGRAKDKFTCLMALAPLADVAQAPEPVPDEVVLQTPDGDAVVVGTLDVVVARALQGEVLIGDVAHAAYIANVCTADVARRRGVAGELIKAAREEAKAAGVEALYVHLMAVNEAGRAFYTSCGFELEKEETANQAHYRGHCLDGVEGLGRTILMRDTLLTES